MKNQWITDGSGKPFYARKEIYLTKEICKARAAVCGLGQFIFHINGQKVGDHELDPGWTNYKKRIQYVTFDVTDDLKKGKNVIGAEVGNGWFLMQNEHYSFHFPPFMPPNPNPYEAFGESLVLALELTVEYADGTSETVYADDSFKVKPHEITMSNVYGSETADGAAYPAGWDIAGFDDSGWAAAQQVAEAQAPTGTLVEQDQPAIKVIRRYEAKYIHSVEADKSLDMTEQQASDIDAENVAAEDQKTGSIHRDIYDLGQNISGMLQFDVKGKKGTKLRFYVAEKLDKNGDVDQMAKNWVLIDNCITYVIGQDDIWETFRMKFAYFAGRYFGVEGLDEHTELRNMYGDAISSAWQRDGSFHCDDERYNQIYDLVEKAVEANMLSVHTDCPTIERFAWQEPNHLMAPSIMYMKRSDRLWNKFLTDLRTDQHTAEDSFSDGQGGRFYPGDGLMPSQSPCYIPNVLPVPGMGSFYDIIPWGSTSILGTYWHYMFYGDEQIIRDNYEAGKKYLAHEASLRDEEGFIHHGLGDWGNPEHALLRENVETAFLYADSKTMAYFAGILGKTKEQAEFTELAEEIKANYNEKLLVQHPQDGYWYYQAWDHKDEICMTQAAEALPLYWGMVPEDKVEDVVRAFRQTLEEKGAFISGEVGLPYIIQTARKYGMNDLICQFITRTQHPSYYAFVLDGETTLGEYWEQNPRSHCHDMMGHIIEWYYNGLAGIRPLEPGFGRIEIAPYLPESMNEFTCSYNSVKGKITVHVTRENGDVKVEADVPETIEYMIL
ncbi:family 78 glycoside hydrolase catalytic domain [Eubacterium ramulus]|uniref:family 78 glycoside hydrolase catalytic domain n=1 Tax=Eubacterium ramulus TaxID=39490 RepID=UPI00300F1132